MKVGIIGLAQSGKTTLYNAITRSSVELYGGAGEVHVGSIPVPDERFDHAVRVCEPKKVTPASFEVTEGGARIERSDEAGRRDRFGTDFFVAVRNADALVLVVRAFEDPAVVVPEGGVDPARDARMILEELLLADLGVASGRLEKLEKARHQKRQSPAEAAEEQVLERIRVHLEALKPIRTLAMSEDERRSIRSYAFVSAKPLILAVNTGEGDGAAAAAAAAVQPLCASEGLEAVAMCARVEAEVAQMEPEEEREFLEALGIAESSRDRLIRAAYKALGVISFFTVGDDEVRAWTVDAHATALAAAERIHSDLARGFIRAEVVAFEEFRKVGGCWDEARAAGVMRLEGREYAVQDGDIVHIRFKL